MIHLSMTSKETNFITVFLDKSIKSSRSVRYFIMEVFSESEKIVYIVVKKF